MKKMWMMVIVACLCMLLGGMVLAEEAPAAEMTMEEIEAHLNALLEAETSRALANAAANVVGDPALIERGKLTGYVGGKDNDYFAADYKIKDCMLTVGEAVVFEVEIESVRTPVFYMATALILDEEFKQLKQIKSGTESSTKNPFTDAWQYTTKQAGYVMFVFAGMDAYKNSITFSSCTVQVSEEGKDPLFDNMAVDNKLSVRLQLEKHRVNVGETVVANCVVSCGVGPIDYVGGWTLYDSDVQALENVTFSGTNDGIGERELYFTYTPTQPGEVVLMIVFGDGEDNQLVINTIGVDVVGSEKLNVNVTTDKTSLNVGEAVTATYTILGHGCKTAKITRGVNYYQNGNLIGSDSEVTKDRTGSFTYFPNQGDEAGLFVEITCEHTEWYGYDEEMVKLISAPVSTRIPGDADESGNVDIMDALLVLRYDVGWDIEINLSNADVDGSGSVDIMDALLILRYDVGWDVELK